LNTTRQSDVEWVSHGEYERSLGAEASSDVCDDDTPSESRSEK